MLSTATQRMCHSDEGGNSSVPRTYADSNEILRKLGVTSSVCHGIRLVENQGVNVRRDALEKAPLDYQGRFLLVEMGGFEPPSKTASRQDPTCVVGILSAAADSYRRDSVAVSQTAFGDRASAD